MMPALAIVLVTVVTAVSPLMADLPRAGQAGGARSILTTASIRQRLRDKIENTNLRNVPAREALEWWSRITKIPIIIDWGTLDREAIDPETPITVQLQRVEVAQLLKLILKQITLYEPVIYQVGPHWVGVLLRQQVLRQSYVRIYNVGDLLHTVPRFNDAPQLDLAAALGAVSAGGTTSGGSGGRGGGAGGSGGGGGRGGSGGLFAVDDHDDDQELGQSHLERGQEIAQLIRDTIEPDIWIEHGGRFASVTYFNNHLVIKAPRFVHDQIGSPSVLPVASRRSTVHPLRSRDGPSATSRFKQVRRRRYYHVHRGKRVSSVAHTKSKPVSSVARR